VAVYVSEEDASKSQLKLAPSFGKIGWVYTHSRKQGCQMVFFRTNNPNLGKFWMAFEWKMMVYFMVIWNILRSFGIFYGHLVML
jgi:hypothetical protein